MLLQAEFAKPFSSVAMAVSRGEMNKHSRTGASTSVAAIAEIRSQLEQQDYICNSSIATALFMAQKLDKPVLVEGPPGVGKTELAIRRAACSTCR